MDTILTRRLREFTNGPLIQLTVNLGGQNGDLWEQQLKQFLLKEPCWTEGCGTQVTEPKPTPSILEPVSTVVVNATTCKFVAKKKFVINTNRNAPVRIGYLGDNFKVCFLNSGDKTEDPISEQTLRYHKLRQYSVDGPIITELGGEAKAETTLSEMFSLMGKQKHGEGGVLLNNGLANIFYIKDSAGVLRAVCMGMDYGGWRVEAHSVEHPRGWLAGRRVFSPVIESSDLGLVQVPFGASAT